jgi:hypothetical protein
MEELIGAAAGGGLLGIFGSVLGKGFRIWERREERADRRLQNEHELRLIEEQAKLRAQETEAEIVKLQTEGSYTGLSASLRHDESITPTSGWVNDVRAMVRPAMTLILGIILGAMVYHNVAEVQAEAAQAIVFSAVTAITWWFGDRVPRASLSR